MISGACRDYRWPPDRAIHDIPICQLLALTACSAWANGMEPENGGYEDRELDREIADIKARDLASGKSNPPPS